MLLIWLCFTVTLCISAVLPHAEQAQLPLGTEGPLFCHGTAWVEASSMLQTVQRTLYDSFHDETYGCLMHRQS